VAATAAEARELLLTLRAEEKAAALDRMDEEMEGLAVTHSLDEGVAGPSAAEPAEDAVLVDPNCIVCLDERKSVLFLPCKHICVCEACARKLTRARPASCPLCRAPIADVMTGLFY
jgi:hypothetical protein